MLGVCEQVVLSTSDLDQMRLLKYYIDTCGTGDLNMCAFAERLGPGVENVA